jgi:hypothetical protein
MQAARFDVCPGRARLSKSRLQPTVRARLDVAIHTIWKKRFLGVAVRLGELGAKRVRRMRHRLVRAIGLHVVKRLRAPQRVVKSRHRLPLSPIATRSYGERAPGRLWT